MIFPSLAAVDISQTTHPGVIHAYSEEAFSSFNPLLENLDIERSFAGRPCRAGAGAAAFSSRNYR
jgi:hypothetical protein